MKKFNFNSIWLTRLLAVLLAILIWMFVFASDNPDVYAEFHDMPVTFVGIQNLASQNLVMTTGAKSEVDLRLTGKLKQMYMVQEDAISVTADLSSILAPGEYMLPYSVDTGVAGVEATKRTEHIAVKVERLVTRTIPVTMDIQTDPAPGFVCTEMDLSSDAVSITGPESAVNQVHEIRLNFSFEGIYTSGTKVLDFHLLGEKGNEIIDSEIRTDIASIRIAYTILQEHDIPLQLDVIPTNRIGVNQIRCTVQPEALTIQGPATVMGALHSIPLGSVNLESLLQRRDWVDNRLELRVPLTSIPNGVICHTAPDDVLVTVELPDMVRGTVTVPSDYFAPVEGVEFLTQNLTIDIIGSAAEVAASAPVQMLVTPLLAEGELENGRYEIPVRIDCGRNVSVIGDYTIMVEVMEH